MLTQISQLILGIIEKIGAALGANGGILFRYLVTSAVNVVNHQILLQLAVRWWGWSGGAANVFAAMIAVIPAYLLSRYWVWQLTGPSSVRKEILPFWTIAAIGLVSSTVAAELADRRFADPLWISVASLAAYFVVWVVKFIVLNILFERRVDKIERVRA